MILDVEQKPPPTAAGSQTIVQKPPAPDGRVRVVGGVVALLLLVLLCGTGYRQLVVSQNYRELAQRQSTRFIAVPAPRGLIYDREQRILAGTATRTDAVVNLGELRQEFAQEEQTVAPGPIGSVSTRREIAAKARLAVLQRHRDRLGAIIGRPGRLDARRVERHFARERIKPFVLLENLDVGESRRLVAGLGPYDPVRLLTSHERVYPHGGTAGHVLGVVRQLPFQPKSEPSGSGNSSDSSGVSGIEKQLDAILRGQPGEQVVRVDAFGFQVGSPLSVRESVAGQDVVLSLDLDLQRAAEQAMDSASSPPRGGVVAIDVNTGEILAMASRPAFDPAAVLGAAPPRDAKEIVGNDWFNRAVAGFYPPGSTFKIYTVLAALRTGSLQPETTFHCDGHFDVGGHRFSCHNPVGHGALSLRMALAQSCNVYAFNAGLSAGPEALAAEARRFHFAEPTGIELPGESRRMLVPDPGWKEAMGLGQWTAGDTVNFAMGQGFLRVSPLQAACAMASLARRETLTVPTLLRGAARSPTGGRPREPLGLSDRDYQALVASLRAVVESGIGRDAQVPGVEVAGKTGTAQIVRPEGRLNVAWFVAFAPTERPEIAVAVALEGERPGEEFAGAERAAPVVREVVGAYFDKKVNRRR